MGLRNWLHNKHMSDPVDGTLRLTSCSASSPGAAYSNCRMQGVVSAPGIDPVAVEHLCTAPTKKWPQPGQTIPVRVDRTDSSRLEVRWDDRYQSARLTSREENGGNISVAGVVPPGAGGPLVALDGMSARLDKSVEVAVSVDRAWQLVATGEGLSLWFVNTTVVPGPAGSVTLRFAPGAEGTMPIVVWDPPRRIRFGAAEGSPGRAHDFRVTEGADGGSMVRLIDDGVNEAEADATAQGWDMMLQRLQAQAAQH